MLPPLIGTAFDIVARALVITAPRGRKWVIAAPIGRRIEGGFQCTQAGPEPGLDGRCPGIPTPDHRQAIIAAGENGVVLGRACGGYASVGARFLNLTSQR